MKFSTYVVVFVTFYSIFNRIIKKTDLCNRLFNKSRKLKHFLLFIVIMFLFEYGKQLLNEIYGRHNYMSIILGAFLGVIYINFVPFMFQKK